LWESHKDVSTISIAIQLFLHQWMNFLMSCLSFDFTRITIVYRHVFENSDWMCLLCTQFIRFFWIIFFMVFELLIFIEGRCCMICQDNYVRMKAYVPLGMAMSSSTSIQNYIWELKFYHLNPKRFCKIQILTVL